MRKLTPDHFDRIVWLLTGEDQPKYRINVIGYNIDPYTLYERV